MKAKIFMVLVSLLILLPVLAFAQGGWAALPAQAFISTSHSYQWLTVVISDSECYLYPVGGETPNFVAPVVFPPEADGLSVRQMNATVADFDASSFVAVQLYRMNRFSGMTHNVFSASSGSSEAPGKIVITDAAGSYRLIDSSKYVWFVRVFFPASSSSLRFYAVRIQYQ